MDYAEDGSSEKPKYRPNKKLKYQRERRGWTQSELVDRLIAICEGEDFYPSISNDTVSRWERGIYSPDPYWRKKLAELFGVSLEDLGVIEPPEGQELSLKGSSTQATDAAQASLRVQPAKGVDVDGRQSIQIVVPNGTPHVITV